MDQYARSCKDTAGCSTLSPAGWRPGCTAGDCTAGDPPNDAPPWTGFGNTDLPLYTGISPFKNLWDWLGLLIIPLFLALGAAILGRAQQNRAFRAAELDRQLAEEAKQNEWAIEKDRQEQTIVEGYYSHMAGLMLNHGLRSSAPDDDVRAIARAVTVAVFRSVNGERKGQVLQFLYEANSIRTPAPIIDLQGADLRSMVLESAVSPQAHLAGTDLHEAKLDHANLAGSDFGGANMIRVELRRSDLRKANLTEAYLSSAHLREADLDTAVLCGALLNDVSLIEACLQDADLSAANLVGANVSRATLQGADLSHAKSKPSRAGDDGEDGKSLIVHEATYDAATTWPEDYDPAEHGAILIEA